MSETLWQSQLDALLRAAEKEPKVLRDAWAAHNGSHYRGRKLSRKNAQITSA